MFGKLIRGRIPAMLALFVALGLAACDDTSTGVETGELSILLTDEPGDFHTAMVTISGIYLQGDAGEDADRVWLMEDEVTTDLLTLENDVLALVEGAEVSAGNYAQLRFVISGGYIEVEQEDESTLIYATQGYEHVPEGREVDGSLQMPSYDESGLKVNIPGGGVQVGATSTVLLVDFSVAESFGQQAGMSGTWVMDPVIRAEDFGMSSSLVASLELGEDVELPEGAELSDFTARLEDEEGNEKEAAFVLDDDTGEHTAAFSFLLPDASWTLTVDGPDGVVFETDPELPVAVDVPSSGGDIDVDLTITAATAS